MRVDLVPLRGWPLYPPDARYDLGWTQLRPHPLHPEQDAFYAVTAAGAEVARVHLDRRPMDLGAWRGVPEVRPTVRVQLLEVATGERGRGLGRAIVTLLAARCAPARLIAVSIPEAAGFWEALGWARFEHGIDGDHIPLYVAPPL